MEVLVLLLLLCPASRARLGGQEELEDLQEGEELDVEGTGLLVTLEQRSSRRCVRQARRGDFLTVRLEGRLDGGKGKQFLDTRKQELKKTITFQLGAGRVVQGLERGLLGLSLA